ncbi:hypothetical protein [Heyndrickxia coagulans]|uniref:hypothetical protein n=1 Tax=Heyndrickxia coagulans TaxID=1398 RepID=UPI000778F995|nr:hypothetical protein [Heyndrickxia coagulans]
MLAVIIIGAIATSGGQDSSSSENTKETTTTKEKTSTTEKKANSSQEKESTPSKETVVAEHFKSILPSITDDQLELNQKSYDYIVKNYSLFPAKTSANIQKVKQMADSSVNAKLLNKNVNPYLQKIVSFEGNVVSVEEKQLDDDNTISITHVMDDDMQSYQVIMYKSTGNILEDDRVRFWGAPVGSSSFENVSGGSTNVQDFIGAHMEKIQ